MDDLKRLISDAAIFFQGRSGADLNIINKAREIIDIVQDLAKADPISWGSSNRCVFCTYDYTTHDTASHQPSCLWRRAVEVCK